jgi:hypothetical protein
VVLPQEAEIWIGTRRLRHRTLTEVEMWLYEWPNDLKARLSDIPGVRILDHRAVRHRYEPHGTRKLPSEFYDFFTLLHTTKTTTCKDARDRVYAIIPLIPARERLELDIVPDYSISRLELWKRIAKKIRRLSQLGYGPYAGFAGSDLLDRVLEIEDTDDMRLFWGSEDIM